jgi:HEAT repeat protein
MLWWTVTHLKSVSANVRLGAVTKIADSDESSLAPNLIPLLGDKDQRVRIAAAEGLGRLRCEAAVPALEKCLKDPAVDVRMAAVKGLKLLRSPKAAPALVEALNDDVPEIGGQAAHALRQLNWEPTSPKEAAAWRVALGEFDAAVAYGSEAVEPLVRLTKNAPFHLCIRAVDALSRTGDPQVVKPLLDCLRHQDDIVRSGAATALGQLGDARAVDPLLAVLQDQNQQVALAACGALSKLGDRRAVEPVIALLASASADLRTTAAETLGKLRDTQAVLPVVALLKDVAKTVREAAAIALGSLRDERAIEALVMAMTDSESLVRQSAIRSLRLIDPYWERSEAALRMAPALQELLRSREYWIRQSAAEVLSKLGQAQPHNKALATESDSSRQKQHVAAEILMQMLTDSDRDFRQAAAEGFGRLNLGDVSAPLLGRLSDKDRDVQLAAARSLELLRWQPTNPVDQARLLVTLEKWPEAAALGGSAIDALSSVISWGEPGPRRRAIEALVQIGGPQAESALITIAADADEVVRADARSALTMMGSEAVAGMGRRATRLAT